MLRKSHTSKRVILPAKANRLEAGGFNLIMDNKKRQKSQAIEEYQGTQPMTKQKQYYVL